MNSAFVIPITVVILVVAWQLTSSFRGDIKDLKSKFIRLLETLIEEEISIESEYFSSINDHYTPPTQGRIDQYRQALIHGAHTITKRYVTGKDRLRNMRARITLDHKHLDNIDCALVYNILVVIILNIIGCVINELYSIYWYVLISWFIPLIVLFYAYRGLLEHRKRIRDGY